MNIGIKMENQTCIYTKFCNTWIGQYNRSDMGASHYHISTVVKNHAFISQNDEVQVRL